MIWELSKADKEFSLFIRNRDGKCQNPLCVCGLNYSGAPIQSLDCSHYYDRGIWLTRFDPDNCIALGRRCHQMLEEKKDDEYKWIMERRLGKKEFSRMQKMVDDYKYKNIPEITREGQIKKCMDFL